MRAAFGFVREKLAESGHRIVKASALYESPPWGFESEHAFLNQALVVETAVSPEDFLAEMLELERRLGRERKGNPGYASRAIDIDMLFWDDAVIRTASLEVPHPRLHLRKFALVPLEELMPGYIHPVLHEPVSALLQKCPDVSAIVKLDE